MWYLCGLGSNIEPERNVSKALSRLLDETGWLWVSEIIQTEPVGIQTTKYFLNALVAFWSLEEPHALKHRLNVIEEALGRDRSDPERSRKDHVIDIDIIEYSDRPWFSGQQITEQYFRNLFKNHLGPYEMPVSISFDNCTLGKTPMTIFRIHNTKAMFIC